MNPIEILRTLAQHQVDYIVVGGTAAVLQGAPVSTFDLDIIYSRAEPNVTKIMAALTELDAVFRADPRRLRPKESHLRSAGHKLLETRYGVLDVLGTVEENTSYEDLLGDAVPLLVSDTQVMVLSLPRLIAIKEQLTRPKDRAMLLVLRATLEERERLERKS